MSKLNIGDRIVFGESEREKAESIDITVGKIYTIIGKDEFGDLYFIDDVGDLNFSTIFHPLFGKPNCTPTKVV